VVRASPIRRNFQTLHANHLLRSSPADISSRRLLSLLSAPLRVRFQRKRSLAAIVHSGPHVGRLFDGSSGSIRWCNMVNPNWALRVCGTRLPREERTGPARERQCSAIILPLRGFSQRSSWAISPRCSATRCDPKARPRSSAHRDTASVGRALGRDLARGFRFGRDVALVAQT
jgi:hypothetical protein